MSKIMNCKMKCILMIQIDTKKKTTVLKAKRCVNNITVCII